jgi:catechol 2,3-dioxygenase-like lactoylglutathione lyase family enzyme
MDPSGTECERRPNQVDRVRGSGIESLPQEREEVSMLDQYNLEPTLPASDIDRAKAWYRDKLGFTPEEELPDGSAYYRSGSSRFYLYATQFAGTAQNTAAGWIVDDLDKEMEELRGRGVVFEEYDFPGLKTVNGVAEIEGIERSAWFKDSEGNILSLGQRIS